MAAARPQAPPEHGVEVEAVRPRAPPEHGVATRRRPGVALKTRRRPAVALKARRWPPVALKARRRTRKPWREVPTRTLLMAASKAETLLRLVEMRTAQLAQLEPLLPWVAQLEPQQTWMARPEPQQRWMARAPTESSKTAPEPGVAALLRTPSTTRSWGFTSTRHGVWDWDSSSPTPPAAGGGDRRRAKHNGPFPGRGTASLVPQNGDSCSEAIPSWHEDFSAARQRYSHTVICSV
ncbi:hypothetical protein CRENBAI_022662 [Crenichthys baileyi]|uniref:Uncharacterized protein n=1 Tax=Crenichthys baileyi TaxID=28760 RepID=A0AAV9RI18_9TELE